MIWDTGMVVRIEFPGRPILEEDTFSASVNTHGALIFLEAKVEVGQEVVLVNPQSQKEVRANVMRVGSAHAGLCMVAVEFLEPSNIFWPFEKKG